MIEELKQDIQRLKEVCKELEKHYSDDGMESVHEKHKVWG